MKLITIYGRPNSLARAWRPLYFMDVSYSVFFSFSCHTFGVSGTFRSRLMVQHLSDGPRDTDIATLTWSLR